MLVLSRRIGQEIVIVSDIRITVVDITGARVRLGIAAPRSIVVDRAELATRKQLNEIQRITDES